jgi:hypothetical protein
MQKKIRNVGELKSTSVQLARRIDDPIIERGRRAR